MSYKQRLDTFNMETKFDGLIKLLAEGLYSEPDIFVRELIQNSHDSIIRRKETEPQLAGRIDIRFDAYQQTIVFSDNGIGMDEHDIRNFLSVIGSSGTGTARSGRGQLTHELIGQFGIGMLSAFVVADKVYVETLKRGSSSAYEWRNSGSEECQLYSSNKKWVGSDISVFIRDDYTYFISEKKLKDIIIRYCDFISVPIYLNGAGPVNSVDVPWNREFPSPAVRDSAYHDFINRRFTDYSLDVFPFDIQGKYRAKGILYISDRHVADVNTGGLLDIFIRRMLVKQADSSLLPSWAKFVRGVIDSPDLKPTAARDNIQSSDESFEYIRQELGKVIVQRLSHLAKELPDRFRSINEWHHYHLKGMAYFHDEFFEQVADMLLFETNRGMMSLHDYLPKNELMPDKRAPLYFFAHFDSAAQYYRLADAKNVVVINGGRQFDEELLKKYAEHFENRVSLQQLDNISDGVLFETISSEELESFVSLEQEFTFALNRSGLNVTVETKRFVPYSIPALIVESKRTKAEENLRALMNNPALKMSMANAWSEVMDDSRRKQIKLVINATNPVISGLREITDRRFKHQMLISIYNNAMLYAHRMTEENMNIIHDSMVGMMADALTLYGEKATLTAKLEENRREGMTQVRPELTDHIRLFVITPYDKQFDHVQQGLSQLFESKPFYFEVRRATAYTHKGGTLVRDTKEHIAQSHGFIADITELNPNVMMELGAVMMTDDPRPTFVIRSSQDTTKTPVDLGDKLRIDYTSCSDTPENIAESLRANFISEDGTILREDLKNLMAQRKAKFLSKCVLKETGVVSDEQMIAKLCGRYTTVEALLNAENDELSRLGLKPYQIQGLKDELKDG